MSALDDFEEAVYYALDDDLDLSELHGWLNTFGELHAEANGEYFDEDEESEIDDTDEDAAAIRQAMEFEEASEPTWYTSTPSKQIFGPNPSIIVFDEAEEFFQGGGMILPEPVVSQDKFEDLANTVGTRLDVLETLVELILARLDQIVPKMTPLPGPTFPQQPYVQPLTPYTPPYTPPQTFPAVGPQWQNTCQVDGCKCGAGGLQA